MSNIYERAAAMIGKVDPDALASFTASAAPSLERQHSDMVLDLSKPGTAIIETMTPVTADMLHMAVGVAGEAGELLDAVKKHVIYNKTLDRANVIEELGDLEFYMEGLRQTVGVSREETLQANIAKLAVRYAGGYSDKAAQERADKQ